MARFAQTTHCPLPTGIVRRGPVLEIADLGTFHLKLQFVRNQGNKLRVRGFSLGIGHRIAEEPLQGIQIPPIPGHLDGMADGSLHSRRRGAEVFGYLRIEHLGNGVACLTARLGVLPDRGVWRGIRE